MQTVCLIIPCYNEEARFKGEEIFHFLREHDSTGICLVNDGSSDGTIHVLEALRSRSPDRVFVINLETNQGKAAAVREGVRLVEGMKRFGFVGYWDADLSTPLSESLRLLDVFRSHSACRLAMASRVRRLGSSVERKASRHVLGRVFSTFASIVLNLPVYDSQCGAKVFRVDVSQILFGEPFLSRWLFDVELLARFRDHFGREETMTTIVELPVMAWAEVGGSKLRVLQMMKVPYELLRIYFHYNLKR